MNGVLNINKPEGITSHDVVSRVRRLLKIRKVGHTGTLDPFATGVLPICVGKSTRIIRFLPDDKEYIGRIKLGEKTNTYDRTGEVISQEKIEGISIENIKAVAKEFMGEIEQIPPLYSAIKVKGKKLYELARKGEEVEVEPRKVTIYDLKITEFNLPFFTIKLHTSAGTYIRSIANDIGEKLGCGAHLYSLIRMRAGHFAIEDSVQLEQLTEENILDYIIEPNWALRHLSSIILEEEEVQYMQNGRAVENRLNLENMYVRLLDKDKNLIAVGEILEDAVKPIRVFV